MAAGGAGGVAETIPSRLRPEYKWIFINEIEIWTGMWGLLAPALLFSGVAMRDQSQLHRRSACLEPRGAQRGFTVPELLMVVALIGLIALAAIPAFGTFYRSWKVRSAADEMLAVTRSVRQMAISTRQDLTITFTPGQPGTYSYFHPIQGQTVTVTLPGRITMTTNPSGGYAPEFKINGGAAPSSTPDMRNPTANFVRLSADIGSGKSVTYTFGFSAAGMVSYTVTR